MDVRNKPVQNELNHQAHFKGWKLELSIFSGSKRRYWLLVVNTQFAAPPGFLTPSQGNWN